MILIDDISFLTDIKEGLGINISYANIELKDVEITKVLLERYVIEKTSPGLPGLKEIIETQTVLQSMGSNTSHISNVFSIGGGDIQVDGKMLDITKAWENKYTYIVDSGIDIENNFYLYRIITYGQPTYEKATRYIAGLDKYDPVILNEDIKDFEYTKFLDQGDIEEIIPNNSLGIIKWLNGKSLFHETYRLRQLGEIDGFKFSTYWQRAWMIEYFLKKLESANETFMEKLIEDVNELIPTQNN